MHYEKTHRIVPRADSCGTGFNYKRREQSAKGTEQRTCKATEKELKEKEKRIGEGQMENLRFFKNS